MAFFQTSWGVGVPNSAIFNGFQIGLSLARFSRAFGISGGGGGGVNPPLVRHCLVRIASLLAEAGLQAESNLGNVQVRSGKEGQDLEL